MSLSGHSVNLCLSGPPSLAKTAIDLLHESLLEFIALDFKRLWNSLTSQRKMRNIAGSELSIEIVLRSPNILGFRR